MLRPCGERVCNLEIQKSSLCFLFLFFCCCFFLSGFSFTDTDNSQDSRGREGAILFHSTTSTRSRTFSHLCFKRLQVFNFYNDLLATHLFNDSKLNVSIEILTWDFKNAYHTVDHLFFKRHFYVFLFLI